MTRKTVKRVKTGSIERRFSMARAGFMAGAKYATASAGSLFTPKAQREERRKEILSARAQELVEELGQLKGSVVKIGQMMALFGEHFLPEEVTTALHTLENQTSALEWPAIERHLRKELGDAKLAQLEIEETPLGAASLAQVHKAVRKSDGRELCLKIQYPGVADAIDSDMRALVRLLKLSRLVPITEQFNEWLDEVREMLRREVDYDLEAHTTRHFRSILAEDRRFVVPEIISDYSTHNIMCMSFEHGINVSDPAVLELSQERRNFIGRAIMELCCREVFEWNKMQTDPNFGNYLLRIGEDTEHDQIVLLDFGAIRDFDDEVLGPGREMIRASFYHDSERLFRAMSALEFLGTSAPKRLLDDFAQLCFEAVEVLQDPDKYPPPASVLNDKGEYCWGKSNLPNRIMNRASRNAVSIHFDVPPKEFIFLARKLLGAYTFLHVIESEVRGNTILEPFIHMREDEDRAAIEQKLGKKGLDR
ncbi:ABC1/ AarF family protein [Alcanivorax hongdengensis A-11-3]|uniref:ABC1/ AarF family protein n=1 Tax=Alcanivorax hongdengensis A-11-3 TaxID=1177179 RepID=L0WAQ5_9GAMM|nr:AarF/ABC1/UbiB kinase family protein [Alcanivorax hongdengensis]EKF72805.1 ABC1/ AarF family protein [Alcanivorax hongdengensis A-11-3]